MESDPRYNVSFNQGLIGLALIDSKTGNLVKVNRRFCDIAGLNEDKAEGTAFMEINHPEDLQGRLHHVRELLEGGLEDFNMQKCFTHENGEMIFCDLTLFPLWNIGDESDYYILILEDVTARKRTEMQLQQINDLLGKRVVELTAALDEKIKELEVTNKVLSRMGKAVEA